jgi:hypothetical protein
MQMLPLMGGMLTTSILTGQLISRTGRYKKYPIAGTAVMTVGLFLLSRMSEGTTMNQALLIMLVLGAGLGLVMQVLVIAGQNAVDYRDLGVATSGATMFRLVGGSLGTAALGAIFSARLSKELSTVASAAVLNGAHGPAPGLSGLSPASIAALPPAVRAVYSGAFSSALSTVFLVAAVIAFTGFLLALTVPEIPLRKTIVEQADDVEREVGATFPNPGERVAGNR